MSFNAQIEFDESQQPNKHVCLDDDDPFASDRLCAIFSEGIVVEENRITSLPTITKPAFFLNRRQALYEKAQKEFNSIQVQQDFVKRKFNDRANRTSCEYRFDPKKKISIVKQLESAIKTANKFSLEIRNNKYSIPDVYDDNRENVNSILILYADDLLREIDLIYSVDGKRVDTKTTSKFMDERLKNILSNISRFEIRIKTSVLFAKAILLEQLVIKERDHLISFLKYTVADSLIENDDYYFLRIDSSTETVDDRLKTVIQPSCIGTAVNVVYNFNMQQLTWLVDYIFAKSLPRRTAAKVSLLSSMKTIARNDVVQNPGNVLKYCFMEHYLTRSEILTVVFHPHLLNHNDHANRCPHCEIIVALQPDRVVHPFCPLVKWLTNKFNYEFEPLTSTVSVPSLTAVTNTVGTYLRQMVTQETSELNTPFISSVGDELRVLTLNIDGKPVSSTITGPKRVTLADSITHGYNTRSSVRK